MANAEAALVKSLRVLSIQSSVVHGYVGNKVAVPCMQQFGLDVSPINTVQFSNHTGYQSFTGKRLDSEDFDELISGLRANDLMNFNLLISGYIGSESFLSRLVSVVSEIKEKRPNLFFACDPVMGDHGKFYTPKEFVELYKSLLRFASLITPNQFEAEKLSDQKITSLDDAGQVCQFFHDAGIPYVVLTSVDLNDVVYAVYSTKDQADEFYSIQFDKMDQYVSGTGDLTTALLASWLQKTKDFHQVVANSMSAVQTIIESTQAAKSKELLFIENLDALRNCKPAFQVKTHKRKIQSS